MKALTRSTITAATLAGILAAAATPAAAIVGGHDATQPYPGMAFVGVLYPGIGTAQCGGTLITPTIVLTAAHCVSDEFVAPAVAAVPADRVTVRVGSNDRTTGGMVAVGAKIMLHPDWQWLLPTGLPTSDLALVTLTRPVPVRLMPLDHRQVRVAQRLRLIGWGLTAFPVPAGSPLPIGLQQRDITVLPAAACAGGAISAGEICTSTGTCFGDSGGPALTLTGHPGRRPWWQEVGLAGRETTDPTDPDANPCQAPVIYTSTTYGPFRQWISETIRAGHAKPCTCPHTVRSLDPATRDRINRVKPRINC